MPRVAEAVIMSAPPVACQHRSRSWVRKSSSCCSRRVVIRVTESRETANRAALAAPARRWRRWRLAPFGICTMESKESIPLRWREDGHPQHRQRGLGGDHAPADGGATGPGDGGWRSSRDRGRWHTRTAGPGQVDHLLRHAAPGDYGRQPAARASRSSSPLPGRSGRCSSFLRFLAVKRLLAIKEPANRLRISSLGRTISTGCRKAISNQ